MNVAFNFFVKKFLVRFETYICYVPVKTILFSNRNVNTFICFQKAYEILRMKF